MAFLSLLAFSFAGGIVWIFNVESAAVLYGGKSAWHPLAVGLTCAAGQTLAYTFLFYCGDWLYAHWRWAGRKIERTRLKYGERLSKSFLTLTAPAALVGLPPMTAMAALAGSFQVRPLPLLAIAFSLRVVRFTLLAAVGQPLLSWWGAL